MLLSKETILEMLNNTPPLIENMIDQDTQVQVTGVDLTVGEIFLLENTGTLDFNNKGRQLPARRPVFSIVIQKDTQQVKPVPGVKHFNLTQGTYIVKLHETVTLPKDISAIVYPRSSLVRCGAMINSGFWDAGFSGRGEVMLTVGEHGLILTPDARICQISFIRADKATEGYEGIYQEKTEAGNEGKELPEDVTTHKKADKNKKRS